MEAAVNRVVAFGLTEFTLTSDLRGVIESPDLWRELSGGAYHMRREAKQLSHSLVLKEQPSLDDCRVRQEQSRAYAHVHRQGVWTQLDHGQQDRLRPWPPASGETRQALRLGRAAEEDAGDGSLGDEVNESDIQHQS